MNEPDSRSIAAWFDTMQEFVVNQDYAAARNMFDANVIGFGSRTAVEGIDFLERDQWRLVWPKLKSFTFDVAQGRIVFSDDGSMAMAAVPWSSVGETETGGAFDRPGRATVVFRQDADAGDWRAIHIHFSLATEPPARPSAD